MSVSDALGVMQLYFRPDMGLINPIPHNNTHCNMYKYSVHCVHYGRLVMIVTTAGLL